MKAGILCIVAALASAGCSSSPQASEVTLQAKVERAAPAQRQVGREPAQRQVGREPVQRQVGREPVQRQVGREPVQPQVWREPSGSRREAVERLEVPPPPITEGMFPCSGCHASMEPNRTPRQLTEMHTEIVLTHGERHRWCLDCHEAANRDVLHLAGGQLVPFEESYRLCGQCHGKKLRDWQAGVHGRRSGEWNGHKTYLLCAHCHDPHRPRFAPVKPEPPPRRPATED